jgi:hypothetical protein
MAMLTDCYTTTVLNRIILREKLRNSEFAATPHPLLKTKALVNRKWQIDSSFYAAFYSSVFPSTNLRYFLFPQKWAWSVQPPLTKYSRKVFRLRRRQQ